MHPSAPDLFRPVIPSPLFHSSMPRLVPWPSLLNTGQIDAFLIWEPIVANAELSGIGKRIAVPSDLPPPGKWDNAAINIQVLRQDTVQASRPRGTPLCPHHRRNRPDQRGSHPCREHHRTLGVWKGPYPHPPGNPLTPSRLSSTPLKTWCLPLKLHPRKPQLSSTPSIQ